MRELKVNLPGMTLKNPIITASGTFGFGRNMSKFYDLNILGAITTKTVTLEPRKGNKLPRVAEDNGTYINSIGLENPGIEKFINEDLKWLENNYPHLNVIVNIGGSTIEEYLQCVKLLNREKYIKAYEINVSCPNVKSGGITFGKDPHVINILTKEIKKIAKKPIFIKLTPNVTDIVTIAKSAIDGGCDGLTLINTLVGMSISLKTKKPILGNIFGGVSGPSIKPVAMKAVYDVASKFNIPIIATGGCCNSSDVLEFICSGATCVSVGTANLINPFAAKEIVESIEKTMENYNIKDVNEIRGLAFKE